MARAFRSMQGTLQMLGRIYRQQQFVSIFYELKTKFNQNFFFKNVSTFFSLQLCLYVLVHTDHPPLVYLSCLQGIRNYHFSIFRLQPMLRLGPPATLIDHQNGGFEKKKKKTLYNWRNLNTPALRFSVDGNILSFSKIMML